MTTLISGTIGRQRLGAYVLTAFASAALVLAAIGVSGIVGYSIYDLYAPPKWSRA